MNRMIRTLALGFATLGMAFLATAGETTITVTGKIVCAKCSLKKADATECQNVLIVEGDKAGEYYLAAGTATEELEHVCEGVKEAVVTGTVETKDGKTWLTPTKVEAPKKS